jgi:hypothetical protein
MNRLWIERMRERPKDVRVHVSFLAASAFTGLVALVWGVTLPARFDVAPTFATEEITETQEGLGTFFSESRTNLGQVIGAMGADEQPAPTAGSISETGTYMVGAPEEGDTPSAFEVYYGANAQGSVAQPATTREVRIATSTSAR